MSALTYLVDIEIFLIFDYFWLVMLNIQPVLLTELIKQTHNYILVFINVRYRQVYDETYHKLEITKVTNYKFNSETNQFTNVEYKFPNKLFTKYGVGKCLQQSLGDDSNVKEICECDINCWYYHYRHIINQELPTTIDITQYRYYKCVYINFESYLVITNKPFYDVSNYIFVQCPCLKYTQTRNNITLRNCEQIFEQTLDITEELYYERPELQTQLTISNEQSLPIKQPRIRKRNILQTTTHQLTFTNEQSLNILPQRRIHKRNISTQTESEPIVQIVRTVHDTIMNMF